MSLTGLMGWSDALPRSSLVPTRRSPLQVVAAEAAGQSPESLEGLPLDSPPLDSPWSSNLRPPAFINAVARQAGARLDAFVRGVRGYHSHPYRRAQASPPVVWRRGAAAILDYGGPHEGPPVLFVPSLINRAYILDLAEDRSVLRSTAAGLRTFLLDWGEPGAAERAFTVDDYVEGVLIPALEEIKDRTGQAARLVGYCIGGTLTVAPAVLRPDLVAALVLLAAPWDFHSETEASRALLATFRPMIEIMLGAHGVAPVDVLQALFASLDPTLVGRKFRSFAALDPASDQARRFVALEDWLNDGVALAGPVAQQVFFSWYGANDPAEGRWKIGDTVIDPRRIVCPTLVLIPTQDRIVPPASARRLAELIPRADARTIDLGHIGMVSGGSAPRRVYAPLLAWLANPPKP